MARLGVCAAERALRVRRASAASRRARKHALVALSLATALAGAGSSSVLAAAGRSPGAEPRLGRTASEAHQTAPPATLAATPQRALLDRYCVTCHNERRRTGGLALDALDVSRVGEAPDVWERVVLKLRGGMMPPAGRPRPAPAEYEGFRSWLE
ncbi:MAG: hypothetical protein OXH69_15815, partial [Acidobacteria bacterium]|nr:hypothetical protein [Acidobacteriota bacterium]